MTSSTSLQPDSEKRNEWHILRVEEIAYNEQCLEDLKQVSWARKIVKSIQNNGGVRDPRALGYLFELRVARELHDLSLPVIHEHRAGIGDSTVDFCLPSVNILLELVSANETQRVQKLTYTEQLLDENEQPIGTEGKFLMLAGDDHAKEMITLQQKIGEKVWKDDQHTKFPIPTGDTLHVILVDERGACGGDGLITDQRRQLVYGPEFYSDSKSVFHIEHQPVKGLFDLSNESQYAQVLRERIDFIAMINEKEFKAGELRSKTSHYFNPFSGRNYKELYKKLPLLCVVVA